MTRDRNSHPSSASALRVPRLAVRALLLAAAGALTALAIAFAAGDPLGGDSQPTADVGPTTRAFSQSNSKNNAAILTAGNMKPGDTKTGEVTITNTGDVPGDYTLSQTKATGDATLRGVLQLTIQDKAGGSPIYQGVMSGFSSATIGTFDPSEAHTYVFSVQLPSNAANSLQGTTTSVQYDWTAKGEDTTTTTTATTPPPTTTGSTDTGAGAGTGGGGGTFTPSGNPVPNPPGLKLGGSTSQSTTDGFSITLTCTQACNVALGGTVTVPGASRVYRLPAKAISLVAGRRITIKYRFPAKIRKAVAKAVRRNKRVTVRATISARTGASAARTVSRTIVIKKKTRRR